MRLLCFFVAVSLSVFGQDSQTGTITGRVVNENGQPLANARVTLQSIGSLQHTAGTVADHEGNFQFSGLEARRYRLFAWLSAYTADLDDAWSRSYRVGDSVSLVLTKGGVITGRVTTQAGEPVVGIRVYARAIKSTESSRLFPPFSPYALERPTDDRGVYRIYGLATGTYVVWAGGSGGMNPGLMDAFDSDIPTYSPASTRDTAGEISVRAGQETTNIDITYRGERGRIVSGSAKRWHIGETGGFGINLTPVGKSKVDLSLFTAQEENSKGFTFRGVEDGDYDITALSMVPSGQAGIVSKRIKVRGADVTGVELVTQPLASVSGRVGLEESKAPECAGKQRPLFTETLVSASPDESQVANFHSQYRWLLGASVNPDAQGNVSLKNIVPGRYLFVPEFSAKYWYLQSITLAPAASTKTTATMTDATRTWTTLKSGDQLSGLTITLAQGAASLHGKLVLKAGETQPEGAFVYLVPVEREKGLDVLRYFTAAVNADGEIALSNIAPGRYWVLVKSDNAGSPLIKLRSPDQAEFRAKLRLEAEAANTTIEFKPCQNVTGFELPIPVSGSVP